MAELSDTKNLNIPRILGSDLVMRNKINAVIDRIDEVVLPISHENSKAHFEMWMPNTKYSKQTAVRTSTCPSWGFYMCNVAGISGTTEPQGYGEGDVISDGTCKWKLKTFGGATSIKHSDLQDRYLKDQHTIESITGLVDALEQAVKDAGKYTNDKIDDLIGGAPSTLDTLKEIADQLSKDSDAVAAITKELATKVDKEEGKQLSTNDYNAIDKAKIDKITITQNINLDNLLENNHKHTNKKVLDSIEEDGDTGALLYGKQGICFKKDAIKYSLIF